MLSGTSAIAATFAGAETLRLEIGATTFASRAKIATAGWSITGAGTEATANPSLAYGGVFSDAAGASVSVAADDSLTLSGTTTLAAAVTGGRRA